MGLSSVEEAAEGILAIVNENMAGALRLVSVQRGHDPRDFALVAYGGAGPLHANAVAKLMGSFPVLVPPAPGLLCAIGDLVADFRDEFAQTYIRLLSEAEPGEVARILDELGGRADDWLESEGIAADTRDDHAHRGHAVPRAGLRDPRRDRPGGDPLGRRRATSRSASTGSTSSSTGSACPARRSEIVNLRAVGFGSVPKPELPLGEPAGADASGRRRRTSSRSGSTGSSTRRRSTTGRSWSRRCGSRARRS